MIRRAEGVYMYSNRRDLYETLEQEFETKILTYITSDRAGFEIQIEQDAVDLFINHLDCIGSVPKISLYLYTRGGNISVAWNIINLLRQYCDELQVIIPHKAHSAGTLMSIGANSIVMTKQATLGPIDPSINTPLNPLIPGRSGATLPVSVEAVKGYLEFAKEELSIKDDIALANILIKLSDSVHPLVLGNVYRSRAQIKMLAEKLLINQVTEPTKIKEIISFLCSDSGSHDYTINRREALNNLGLNIITPNDTQYRTIKDIYDDISHELGFGIPLDRKNIASTNGGEYCVRRGLIESLSGGSHYFVSQGKLIAPAPAGGHGAPAPKPGFIDDQKFVGWKHESIANRVQNVAGGDADAAYTI